MKKLILLLLLTAAPAYASTLSEVFGVPVRTNTEIKTTKELLDTISSHPVWASSSIPSNNWTAWKAEQTEDRQFYFSHSYTIENDMEECLTHLVEMNSGIQKYFGHALKHENYEFAAHNSFAKTDDEPPSWDASFNFTEHLGDNGNLMIRTLCQKLPLKEGAKEAKIMLAVIFYDHKFYKAPMQLSN